MKKYNLWLLSAFLFSCLLFSTTAYASKDFKLKKIPPRDTIASSKSGKKFIKEFTKIVEKKDLHALMRHISPDIHFSFGAETGIVDFIEFWKLADNPKKSLLWKELDKLLNLGGIVERKGSITYPYLFTDWPDDFDAFTYLAITGKRVNFRKSPSINADVIRQLSYEIVLPIYSEDQSATSKWTKIQTHDKKVGYVHSDFVRSHIDYRMFFEEKCDGWKMTVLIAGD